MQRKFAKMMLGISCGLLFATAAWAQGGEIVGAEYGARANRIDVTNRVRSLIRHGRLRFEVSNETFGADPAPHERKVLVIHLRQWGGEVRDFRFEERSVVDLELDPDEGYERPDNHDRDHDHERGLRILRAYYGADQYFVNVTDLLRRHVDDNRLHMHINNDTMGVDPAPKVRKELRVLYVFNGARGNIVVPESGDLRLP